MPKKSPQPWDHYQRLHDRLEQWADWIRGHYPETVGWNVYQGDQEAGLRVQLRNDLHSDSVFQEVSNMKRDEHRVWTTETAWRQLPMLWRHMLWVLYVRRDKYDTTDLAKAAGIDRRHVNSHLWQAFAEMDRIIVGTRHSAHSRA